jgi:hypothetical protein
MALKLSLNPQKTNLVSDVNPVTTEHVIAGSTVEMRVYLFNDNATKRYTNVSITPTNSIVFLAADTGDTPVYGVGGAPLSFADIADTNARSFWYKCVAPAVGDTQNRTDIKLTVAGNEYAV